jgi:uncharacterized membrane protein
MVGEVSTHLTEVFIGTASSSLHIIDLIAEVKVLLTLISQLLAIVSVPGEGIGFVDSLELVHLVEDIGQDVCTMNRELPVLLLLVDRLVKCLAKLRVFLFEVLG